MSKRLVLSCGVALLASNLASLTGAQAAGWGINPAACPDLREDIRDSRVTWSRRDLREDVRDRAVTVCPVSAYRYTAPARVVAMPAPLVVTPVTVRPVYRRVYVAPRGSYYGYRAAPGVVRVNVNVH